MFASSKQQKAYLAPFAVFMLLLGVGELVAKIFEGRAWWVAATPRYWVFPLQTLVCGALLIYYLRDYRWQFPRQVALTLAVAMMVLLLWIAPQQWLGFEPRLEGFEPDFFGATGWPFTANLGARFLRLVVVVPLLEEIFWRGFLLRYLIRDDFTQVPFGSFTWFSFSAVSVFFALAHFGPDFVPALITGALYNFIAIRTRSLSSCVLAHAVTNLLLGLYILRTGQWGFW